MWSLLHVTPEKMNSQVPDGAKLHEELKNKELLKKNESLSWDFYLQISASDNIKALWTEENFELTYTILERRRNIKYCNPPYFDPQSTSVPFIHYCKEQPVLFNY